MLSLFSIAPFCSQAATSKIRKPAPPRNNRNAAPLADCATFKMYAIRPGSENLGRIVRAFMSSYRHIMTSAFCKGALVDISDLPRLVYKPHISSNMFSVNVMRRLHTKVDEVHVATSNFKPKLPEEWAQIFGTSIIFRYTLSYLLLCLIYEHHFRHYLE